MMRPLMVAMGEVVVVLVVLLMPLLLIFWLAILWMEPDNDELFGWRDE